MENNNLEMQNNNVENVEVNVNTLPEEAKVAATTEENPKPKKKKRKIGKIIFNAFTTILFIVIVLEAAIGIINMQRISNKEEPIWYLSTKTTETELKTETEYHLGLYKIVKTDTSKETKITLKPFFLGN